MADDLQRFANDVARRAHAVFRQEGWTYGDPFGPEGYVPTIAQLERSIYKRLREVELGKQIDSGRIRVWREADDEGETFGVDLCLGEFEMPVVS